MPPEVLTKHLTAWLGKWPADQALTVVESPLRAAPGWDGATRPLAGVSSPQGVVLSVPPGIAPSVLACGSTINELGPHLGRLVGKPDSRLGVGVFRWSTRPNPSNDPGRWLSPTDERLPDWVRPFNGDVLVGFDGDSVAAAVGRKQHDAFGHELAVVTEEPYRGRRWAQRLVSQAARQVLLDGAIPTYLHDPANTASGRTADAAGFPDRGWRILGLW